MENNQNKLFCNVEKYGKVIFECDSDSEMNKIGRYQNWSLSL